MGRRRILIQRIADERSRQVTFNKRKFGLMKKAYELSILCDCEIGLVVFSSNNKLFQYASNGMENILLRYGEYNDVIESRNNNDMEQQVNNKDKDSDDDSKTSEKDDCDIPTPSLQAYQKVNKDFDEAFNRKQLSMQTIEHARYLASLNKPKEQQMQTPQKTPHNEQTSRPSGNKKPNLRVIIPTNLDEPNEETKPTLRSQHQVQNPGQILTQMANQNHNKQLHPQQQQQQIQQQQQQQQQQHGNLAFPQQSHQNQNQVYISPTQSNFKLPPASNLTLLRGNPQAISVQNQAIHHGMNQPPNQNLNTNHPSIHYQVNQNLHHQQNQQNQQNQQSQTTQQNQTQQNQNQTQTQSQTPNQLQNFPQFSKHMIGSPMNPTSNGNNGNFSPIFPGGIFSVATTPLNLNLEVPWTDLPSPLFQGQTGTPTYSNFPSLLSGLRSPFPQSLLTPRAKEEKVEGEAPTESLDKDNTSRPEPEDEQKAKRAKT